MTPRFGMQSKEVTVTIPPGETRSTGAFLIPVYGAVVTVTASDGAGMLKFKVKYGNSPVAGHAFGYYTAPDGTVYPGDTLSLGVSIIYYLEDAPAILSSIEIQAVGTTADVTVMVVVSVPFDLD